MIAKVRNDGSLFQSFLYAFRRGTGFCPLWQVSVIARCPEGDIRLYFAILKRHDDRRTSKIYWRSESSEGKRTHIQKAYKEIHCISELGFCAFREIFFDLFSRYITASPRRDRSDCLWTIPRSWNYVARRILCAEEDSDDRHQRVL